MAGYPGPQHHVNPALRARVRASGKPVWQVAAIAGFTHPNKCSALLNAEVVPATPTNIELLQRIADAIGFDRAALFLDEVWA